MVNHAEGNIGSFFDIAKRAERYPLMTVSSSSSGATNAQSNNAIGADV